MWRKTFLAARFTAFWPSASSFTEIAPLFCDPLPGGVFVQRSTATGKKTSNEHYYQFQHFTGSFHLVLCAPFTATADAVNEVNAVCSTQFEIHEFRGGVPERPKVADCKSAVIDFEGSNPSPTTIFLTLPLSHCYRNSPSSLLSNLYKMS